MSRDNIREMLADIEEAVTEDFASLPRYRNDNEGDATVDPNLENLKALVNAGTRQTDAANKTGARTSHQ